jgi:hypothetical protein
VPESGISWSGLESVTANFGGVVRKLSLRAEVAGKGQAQKILVKARQYAPEREGTLRGSGRIEAIKHGGKTVGWRIIFGGPSARHAIPVHQHPSSASPHSWKVAGVVRFSPPGTGPQFLSRALLDVANTALRELAAELQL